MIHLGKLDEVTEIIAEYNSSFVKKENKVMVPDLLFKDWQDFIKNSLGKEQWITVYQISDTEDITFYSALVPDCMVEELLNNPEWDIEIGNGRPGWEYISNGTNLEAIYKRFLVKRDGIEPLVFFREFPGIREFYIEISEEFRHYHNLYYDVSNNRYLYIDDNGDEDDVIIFEKDKVKIKLKYLKEFLSVKKMHLGIYFEFKRYSEKSLEELGMNEFSTTIRDDKYIYSIVVPNDPMLDKKKSFSMLTGKKYIEGLKDYDPNKKQEKEYVDFIIGVDDEGKEICYTHNPNKLAGSTYCKSVFFKREVLDKYYSDPTRFNVHDNYIEFKGFWSLPIDNNNPNYVIVFLGDLCDLPTKEQHYWRSFNIPPDGTISRVAYGRMIMGEFTDPDRNDLIFKQKFNVFQKSWFERFGWYFFIPLEEKDKHNFETLRIPLGDNQLEFDGQVVALTKIIIDSLNEAEFGKLIAKEDKDKGITKLEKYFAFRQLQDYKCHINFLRNLQELRSSGTAHRKGKNYIKVSKYFQLDEKGLVKAFDDILYNAILFLDYLEKLM